MTKTHSRPHVSNDNPYSESQSKTMKYRPEFPERFGGYHDGRRVGLDLSIDPKDRTAFRAKTVGKLELRTATS